MGRELSLSLEDLRARPSVTRAVTMECAGNGRARLEPHIVSQPWLLEAVGTAEWTGVPVRDLLEEAGVADGAVEVLFTGLDRGVEGGVEQSYQRSLPVDEASDGPLLAYAVNGEPLPPQHGFPLRLVVPGWYGMTSVKWLARIDLLDEPFDGYQQAVGYRMRAQRGRPRHAGDADHAARADGPAGDPRLPHPRAHGAGRAVPDRGPRVVGVGRDRGGRGVGGRRRDVGGGLARRGARAGRVAGLELRLGGAAGRARAVLPRARRRGQRPARRRGVERRRLRQHLRPARARDRRVSDLHAAVERFVAETVLPQVADWDRADDLPREALSALAELGVAGALVPGEYGGPGLAVADLVPVWRTLSHGWISLTGAVNPTGLATTLLVRHGTDAQRRHWLPGIARGAVLASFSITEPQAGSDLGRIETSARPRDGGGLILDGEKRWVAGGVTSEVVFMLADVGGEPSCVVLPADGRGTEGWAVEELDKVGYRGVESAAYRFDAFEAAGAEVLGDAPGEGARQMLDALDVGRVNVACRALGIVDRCIACAVEESTTREVGDGLLGEHTHAQLRVGELVARRVVLEAAVARAAAAVDARDDDVREISTAAKVVASDSAVWAVDLAARLAASRSYAAGDELARLRRDAPQTQIGEGANDALLLALSRPLLR